MRLSEEKNKLRFKRRDRNSTFRLSIFAYRNTASIQSPERMYEASHGKSRVVCSVPTRTVKSAQRKIVLSVNKLKHNLQLSGLERFFLLKITCGMLFLHWNERLIRNVGINK